MHPESEQLRQALIYGKDSFAKRRGTPGVSFTSGGARVFCAASPQDARARVPPDAGGLQRPLE
eukprot:2426662-Lingulodinium_polyedra.AAC.1